MAWKENDLVVTFGRNGSLAKKGYPYYAAKLYRATKNKDGLLCWRLDQILADLGRCEATGPGMARERAKEEGLTYQPGIIQHDICFSREK